MQEVRQQGHTAAGRLKKAEWEEKYLMIGMKKRIIDLWIPTGTAYN
jgi:hypothetical protein